MATPVLSTSEPARPRWYSDALLAAALTAFMLVGTHFASQAQPGRRPFDAGTVVLVMLAGGALAFRRTHPTGTVAAAFTVVVAYRLVGYAQGPIWFALLGAYFSAVLHGARAAALGFVLAAAVVFPLIESVVHDGEAPPLLGIAAAAAWLLVWLGVAEAIRIRRERTAEALRMREHDALRRASEERLRIAQELHDALGHHLSLISVQAGVALHVNEELPAQVTGSLTAIRDASKEGLTELRSVLEILRRDDDHAPRSPTSTLDRLDDLVSQASAAGLDVRSEVEGVPRPLPFGVDVAAFRIVQEALTNVARHAEASSAVVRVAHRDGELVVEVDDDGRARVGDVFPDGRGLAGMRERVGALGGDLSAGPKPEGGFRVRARFPLEGPP
jgi:signal transduction histidine kinase